KGEPLYPFGYGLSYTSFAYSNLRLSSDSMKPNGAITIRFNLRNISKRSGEEVVQLYVQHLQSQVARPLKELKGFKRIALKPGAAQEVILTLKAEQLGYWDVKKHDFQVEADSIKLMVGTSSADIKLTKTIRIKP